MNLARKVRAGIVILSLILIGAWAGWGWAQSEVVPEPLAPLPEAGTVVEPTQPAEAAPVEPLASDLPPLEELGQPVEPVSPVASPVTDQPPLVEPVPPEPAPEAPVAVEPALEVPVVVEPAPEAPVAVEPALEAPVVAEPAPAAPVIAEPAPSESTPPSQVPWGGKVVLGPVTHPTPAQHKVLAGEDLHLISAYYYGNARLWRLIYEANRQTISEPNKLAEGITITIPAPPV